MEKKTSYACPLVATCILNHYHGEESSLQLIKVFNVFEEHIMAEAELAFYKQVTPIIVNSINSLENAKEIYEILYQDKIVPCMNAILKGDYCFAYEQYKKTILELEDKYYYEASVRSRKF